MFKSLFFALFWHLWLCWRASYFISDHLLLKNLLRTLNGYPWFQGIISSCLRSGSVSHLENPIHVESESSIDEDNIFVISLPMVKGTSRNLRDLTPHHQGVFDNKRKNWTLALLRKNWQTPTRKIYPKSRPPNQTLLKPSEKARPNQKESWREKPKIKRIKLA